MTGLPLSEVRGPGPITAVELSAYAELIEHENAMRRSASRRRR